MARSADSATNDGALRRSARALRRRRRRQGTAAARDRPDRRSLDAAGARGGLHGHPPLRRHPPRARHRHQHTLAPPQAAGRGRRAAAGARQRRGQAPGIPPDRKGTRPYRTRPRAAPVEPEMAARRQGSRACRSSTTARPNRSPCAWTAAAATSPSPPATSASGRSGPCPRPVARPDPIRSGAPRGGPVPRSGRRLAHPCAAATRVAEIAPGDFGIHMSARGTGPPLATPAVDGSRNVCSFEHDIVLSTKFGATHWLALENSQT